MASLPGDILCGRKWQPPDSGCWEDIPPPRAAKPENPGSPKTREATLCPPPPSPKCGSNCQSMPENVSLRRQQTWECLCGVFKVQVAGKQMSWSGGGELRQSPSSIRFLGLPACLPFGCRPSRQAHTCAGKGTTSTRTRQTLTWGKYVPCPMYLFKIRSGCSPSLELAGQAPCASPGGTQMCCKERWRHSQSRGGRCTDPLCLTPSSHLVGTTQAARICTSNSANGDPSSPMGWLGLLPGSGDKHPSCTTAAS